MGLAGLQRARADQLRDGARSGAGQAHDADAARTGGRGDSGDGVVVMHRSILAERTSPPEGGLVVQQESRTGRGCGCGTVSRGVRPWPAPRCNA